MCGLITGRPARFRLLIQMINTIFAPIISFLPHFFLKEILFTAEKEIMQPGSITSSLGRLSESKCQTSQKKKIRTSKVTGKHLKVVKTQPEIAVGEMFRQPPLLRTVWMYI